MSKFKSLIPLSAMLATIATPLLIATTADEKPVANTPCTHPGSPRVPVATATYDHTDPVFSGSIPVSTGGVNSRERQGSREY